MKNNFKFLFVLGFTGLFFADATAQRNAERRAEGSQRSFTPSNNAPRMQQSQPQRQNNPSFSRPERSNNTFTRPQQSQPSQFAQQNPSQTRPVRSYTPRTVPSGNQQTPATAQQAPVQNTRPIRDNNFNRPRPNSQANNNPGSITRPAPANGQTRSNPQANNYNRPQPGSQNYANGRAGINPGSYNRGGNRGGYNSYRGNNYYTNNYYNNRPIVRYNAYNPSWRYNYYPRRNTIVTAFPFSYLTINFGGYPYRYYDGIYYRPYDNIYRVVAPPFGIYINTLPIGYSRILVRDNPYYYYNGTYYDQYENNYRVVAPPVGAIVESIPEGYETVVIDGETYYKVDDVQYKPVVQDNGEIWYEVIKVG